MAPVPTKCCSPGYISYIVFVQHVLSFIFSSAQLYWQFYFCSSHSRKMQVNQGKISEEELINRLMGIVGHLVQRRTLKVSSRGSG